MLDSTGVDLGISKRDYEEFLGAYPAATDPELDSGELEEFDHVGGEPGDEYEVDSGASAAIDDFYIEEFEALSRRRTAALERLARCAA